MLVHQLLASYFCFSTEKYQCALPPLRCDTHKVWPMANLLRNHTKSAANDDTMAIHHLCTITTRVPFHLQLETRLTFASHCKVTKITVVHNDDSSVAVGGGAITQHCKVELRRDADDESLEKAVAEASNTVPTYLGEVYCHKVIEIDGTPLGLQRQRLTEVIGCVLHQQEKLWHQHASQPQGLRLAVSEGILCARRKWYPWHTPRPQQPHLMAIVPQLLVWCHKQKWQSQNASRP